MSPKDIKEIVKLMHAQGIVSLKTADIELVINPMAAPAKRKRKAKAEPEVKANSSFKGYSEEDLLNWSTRAEEA